jgi:hypothetical protein
MKMHIDQILGLARIIWGGDGSRRIRGYCGGCLAKQGIGSNPPKKMFGHR